MTEENTTNKTQLNGGEGSAISACSLLPCPFCGQKEEMKDGWEMIKISERIGMEGGSFYVVECLNCNASTGWSYNKSDARRLWNSRFKENDHDQPPVTSAANR